MKELRFTLEEPAKRNFGAAKKNKRETGSDYEEKAAGFLQSCGYTILEKNYRIFLFCIEICRFDHPAI